jgi:hypothetical protein
MFYCLMYLNYTDDTTILILLIETCVFVTVNTLWPREADLLF